MAKPQFGGDGEKRGVSDPDRTGTGCSGAGEGTRLTPPLDGGTDRRWLRSRGGHCRSPSPWPLGCSEQQARAEPGRERGPRPGLRPGVPLPCDKVTFAGPGGGQGSSVPPCAPARLPPQLAPFASRLLQPCPRARPWRGPPRPAAVGHSLACLQPPAMVPRRSTARFINDPGQVRFSAGVAPHASTAVSPTKGD